MPVVIVVLPALVWGCHSTHITGDGVSDSVEDGVADPSGDTDDMDEPSDAGAEPIDIIPTETVCGDGILDPEEECDDGNRLNGDGCDWLCRVGDGDPSPIPEDDVPGYEPHESAVDIPGTGHASWLWGSMPLHWTEEVFATLFTGWEAEVERFIEFHRFDSTGSELDTDYTYAEGNPVQGFDLVWNSGEFGLFYADIEIGVFFVRLNGAGKPLSDPLLVVEDPLARMPSADVDGDGYVLVWSTGGDPGVHMSVCAGSAYLHVKLMDRYGRDDTGTGTALFADDASGPPMVAAGSDGFGVTVVTNNDDGTCGYSFYHMNASLTEATVSGPLDRAAGYALEWDGAQYVTAMRRSFDPEDDTLCLAKFDAAGALAEPPTCNALRIEECYIDGPPRFAYGDGGYSLVFVVDCLGVWDLYGLRAGTNGVVVNPARSLVSDIGKHPCNITWTGDRFGVVFGQDDVDGESLGFQVLTRVE